VKNELEDIDLMYEKTHPKKKKNNKNFRNQQKIKIIRTFLSIHPI